MADDVHADLLGFKEAQNKPLPVDFCVWGSSDETPQGSIRAFLNQYTVASIRVCSISYAGFLDAQRNSKKQAQFQAPSTPKLWSDSNLRAEVPQPPVK
jgi:hypothetical protein